MSEPEIMHEREHGGTTDHNHLTVSLRRKAVLSDDLREVLDRRDAVIFLTTRKGYVPSYKYGLQPDQAVRLIAALESALADWHDLPSPEPTPDAHPASRESEQAAAGAVS